MAIETVTHAPNYHQNRRNSALVTALILNWIYPTIDLCN